MSQFIGQDSIDRANRMAAIRLRKRPPDPNVGSHLPPPPGAAPPVAPSPPAKNPEENTNKGPQHGRRSTTTVSIDPNPKMTDEAAASGPAASAATRSGNSPVQPSIAPPVPQLAKPPPPAKVHYLSGGSNSSLQSPRVEVQPLGLTQIFSSRPSAASMEQLNSHHAPPNSLIRDILQEGKEPTSKPSPDLVRCADYVQTQPDALDAFLRKYAASGPGGMRGSARDPPGGAYQTHPPLRLMPPPGSMPASAIQEIPSGQPTPRSGPLPPINSLPPPAPLDLQQAARGSGGGAGPALSGRRGGPSNTGPNGVVVATPPTSDPSHMLLAESTFVRRSGDMKKSHML